MSKHTLVDGLYLYPTPIGSYYAVSTTEEGKSRKFLKALLQQPDSPELKIETLMSLTNETSEEKALELLFHCQKLGWVQGIKESIQSPKGAMEDILPPLMANLSGLGKVLLSDNQGFYLACHGYPHEVAEELSALSAELAIVHDKRSGLLMNNLGLGSHAWSIVDAFGNSQTGFWPVYIGKNRFVITISGIPHFNQPDFVSLIWTLSIRYGK